MGFCLCAHRFHPFNVKDVLDVVLALGSDVPAYVTLDLDVLDPSLFCGTGTPEAGGVFFQDLEEALLALEALNVVGFDMNELSPHYDAPASLPLLLARYCAKCCLPMLNKITHPSQNF